MAGSQGLRSFKLNFKQTIYIVKGYGQVTYRIVPLTKLLFYMPVSHSCFLYIYPKLKMNSPREVYFSKIPTFEPPEC